jgi:hypothetical protein
MVDWTATDVVAFVGACAWLPQIIGWVSASLAMPKLRVIPAATVEIGYTIFGPIVNLPVSFLVQGTDALIDKITLDTIHEKGDRRSLIWKWLNETQHQIRSANGAITAEVVRNQLAIALRVGLLSQIDRTIGFQDLEFEARSQELSAKLVTRGNFLREQHGKQNFIRKLPLRRDRRGVELSGRIWPGGSNEAVTIQ